MHFVWGALQCALWLYTITEYDGYCWFGQALSQTARRRLVHNSTIFVMVVSSYWIRKVDSSALCTGRLHYIWLMVHAKHRYAPFDSLENVLIWCCQCVRTHAYDRLSNLCYRYLLNEHIAYAVSTYYPSIFERVMMTAWSSSSRLTAHNICWIQLGWLISAPVIV